jgi:hypothetical protein
VPAHDVYMHGIPEDVERLDEKLGALARAEAALRLRLGQALEVLSRGGVFELGFSSVAAYAVERCERGARWAEVARCMARRLEVLPGLRQGMVSGSISWSMGELLARVARPEDELRWVEMAESRTVRQMRVLVADAAALREAGAARGVAHPTPGGVNTSAVVGAAMGAEVGTAIGAEVGTAALADSDALYSDENGDGGGACTLTCTVPQEEAWLFEATRSLLEQLGVHGGDAQSEALLSEAQGTLLARLPEGALDLDGLASSDTAREHGLSELARWRSEAEALCERQHGGWLPARRGGDRGAGVAAGAVALAAGLGMASLGEVSHEALDAHVRALAQALAGHELELSLLVQRFHRADGWRRLGYATETQYARERLGASRSSIAARRSLALRLEKLPAVTVALGAGQLGVEAALQVVRVATPITEAAWVARARRRTIKHLREEVSAALAAVRLSGEADCPPPADDELAAFHALEQAVVSGRLRPGERVGGGPGRARPSMSNVNGLAELASEPRRAWWVMLGSLAAWLGSALQMSAAGVSTGRWRAGASAGRVTLRLRMSRANGAWWRALEAQARGWLPRGMSWLRFLCLSVWQAWQHMLGAPVAYGHIYIRDRYRCMSPVCNRRDVTPHHLRFRSAGGSDEDDNVASVCTWCHLCGVHEGRIRARGTAGLIRWELGAPDAPCLVVQGRERAMPPHFAPSGRTR